MVKRRQRWRVAMLAASLAAGLAGCATVAARSAGPEMLYVAGGNELRAVSVEDLVTRGQWRLPGPVVGGWAEAGELQLIAGGAHPAWLEVTAGHPQPRHLLDLDLAPVGVAATGGDAFVLGNRGAQARLLAIRGTVGSSPQSRELPGTAAALALGRNGPQELLLAAVDRPAALELVDTRNLRTVGQVALASAPRQVVGLPYGHKAFVLCASTVAVVDTATPGLLTYLRLGHNPQFMLLKPDGGELYISNADGTVSVVDTTSNEVSDTMAAGLGAGAMAVDAGGTFLYVANTAAGTVSVISLADRRTLAVIHVGQQPSRLVLDPSGLLLFAADQGSDDVAVMRSSLDPASPNSLLALLPGSGAADFLAVLPR
ncbi:MAG TPA: YncE family protein [Terriglobales bacterium]|nr:YncE family protein [Terriglobales bacterium]